MPLREKSVMEQRQEFVRLAGQDGVNRRDLCRWFGISADTAYRWLGRWERGDVQLADRSRRPHHSPRRTEASAEARILAIRDAHPAWGARKIAHCLERDGLRCPTISTVHEVLRRSGRVGQRPVRALLCSGSRSRRRTCCGRWTSRAGSACPTARAAIR